MEKDQLLPKQLEYRNTLHAKLTPPIQFFPPLVVLSINPLVREEKAFPDPMEEIFLNPIQILDH